MFITLLSLLMFLYKTSGVTVPNMGCEPELRTLVNPRSNYGIDVYDDVSLLLATLRTNYASVRMRHEAYGTSFVSHSFIHSFIHSFCEYLFQRVR